MKTNIMKQEHTAFDNLGYALYAFGGLGMEILLMMLETQLWGITSAEWTTSQHILHWMITCAIWGSLGFYLLKKNPVSISKEHKKISNKNLIFAGFIILVSIIYTSFVWNGFKPAIEFANNGIVKFSMQYIYYAFESALILLIIMYGQKAFEQLMKRQVNIPMGGLLLAVTWGLVHIATQGFETGTYTCIQSCLYGLVYLTLNKEIRYSYLAITFMFML